MSGADALLGARAPGLQVGRTRVDPRQLLGPHSSDRRSRLAGGPSSAPPAPGRNASHRSDHAPAVLASSASGRRSAAEGRADRKPAPAGPWPRPPRHRPRSSSSCRAAGHRAGLHPLHRHRSRPCFTGLKAASRSGRSVGSAQLPAASSTTSRSSPRPSPALQLQRRRSAALWRGRPRSAAANQSDNGCRLPVRDAAGCHQVWRRHAQDTAAGSSPGQWAYRQAFTSSAQRAAAMRPWLHAYNRHRPHSALGGAHPSPS